MWIECIVLLTPAVLMLAMAGAMSVSNIVVPLQDILGENGPNRWGFALQSLLLLRRAALVSVALL